MTIVSGKPKKLEFSFQIIYIIGVIFSKIFSGPELPEIKKPVSLQMTKWNIAREMCCENYA